MIISHSPKFLLLSPAKTGSGYREFVFNNAGYMDKSDPNKIETKLFRKNKHATLKEVKTEFEIYGWDINEYYKFTFVRNPWIRIISWFDMRMKQFNINNFEQWRFNQFVEQICGNDSSHGDQSNYYDETFNVFCLEQFDIGIACVCQDLNIDLSEQLDHDYKMSIDNYLYNPSPCDYSKYEGVYTNKTHNMIATKEKNVIALKGYECPEEFKPIKITKENFAVIRRDTHMGKWVTEHKRLDFDQNQLPQYTKYFKKEDVLVNIGANIGCYAKAFVDKASKIICFEPHEEAFACLKYNLAKYPNVELHNTALSNDSHMYNVLDGHANNIGASIIESSIDSERYTMTLDEFDFDKLNFILMDCEGSEYNILIGARNTIDKFKPIIVTEVNDHHLQRFGSSRDQLFLLLDEMGYNYKNIFDKQSLNEIQFDIICFPTGTNYA